MDKSQGCGEYKGLSLLASVLIPTSIVQICCIPNDYVYSKNTIILPLFLVNTVVNVVPIKYPLTLINVLSEKKN